MTRRAASTSSRAKASTPSWTLRRLSAAMRLTRSTRSSTSWWNRRSGMLAEPPGDVGLGARLAGVLEDLPRLPELDELPEVEVGRVVADAGGLLHVVRHDDHRVVLPKLQ